MLDRLQLLEGPRAVAAERRPWSYPAATALHLGLVGAGVIASMFATTAVTDPDLDIGIVFVAPVQLGAMPKLGGGTPGPPRPKAPASAPVEPVQPTPSPEPVQPQVIAALDAEAESTAAPEDEGGRGNGGIGGGGDPDGVPSGVPNGLPCLNGDCAGGFGGSGLIGDGAPSNEPLYVTDRITEPVLVTRIEPEYPETARRAHVSGKVTLRAVISETGDVESIAVLKSHPLLEGAATDAVSRWKYRPARLDSVPVRVYFTVVVTFTLE